MHCKQADSAIETFIGPSFNGTNIFDHKTDLCGDYALLSQHGLCHIYAHLVANSMLSRIGAFLGLFCPDFYSDI